MLAPLKALMMAPRIVTAATTITLTATTATGETHRRTQGTAQPGGTRAEVGDRYS